MTRRPSFQREQRQSRWPSIDNPSRSQIRSLSGSRTGKVVQKGRVSWSGLQMDSGLSPSSVESDIAIRQDRSAFEEMYVDSAYHQLARLGLLMTGSAFSMMGHEHAVGDQKRPRSSSALFSVAPNASR